MNSLLQCLQLTMVSLATLFSRFHIVFGNVNNSNLRGQAVRYDLSARNLTKINLYQEREKNCTINGVDLSSIVLTSNGTRTCFNDPIAKHNVFFDIPICGIPDHHCSTVGSKIVDADDHFCFGAYNASTWKKTLYQNSIPSLEVLYTDGDMCPYNKTSKLKTQVLIVCDDTSKTDSMSLMSDNNDFTYVAKISTSKSVICSMVVEIPSLLSNAHLSSSTDTTSMVYGLAIGLSLVGFIVLALLLFRIYTSFYVQKADTSVDIDSVVCNALLPYSRNIIVNHEQIRYFQLSRQRICSESTHRDSDNSGSNFETFDEKFTSSKTSSDKFMHVPCLEWSNIEIRGNSFAQAIIGKGSFSQVFLAHMKLTDQFDSQPVAVKVINSTFRPSTKVLGESQDQDLQQQMKGFNDVIDEVRILVDAELRIQAPDCLVKVYGIVTGALTDDICRNMNIESNANVTGIVMRYEGGGTLQSLIHSDQTSNFNCKNRLSIMEKVRLLTEIARGLTELHNIDVIHGDIKGDNILLSSANPPKVRLADFGMAALHKDHVLKSVATSTSVPSDTFKGTPTYSAPELLKNVNSFRSSFSNNSIKDCSTMNSSSYINERNEHKTEKTDMYAFAILMWEVLTEKVPFEDIHDPFVLSSKLRRGHRPSLDESPFINKSHREDYNGEVIKTLKAIIMRTWDSNPDRRLSALQCYQILQSISYYPYRNMVYDVYLLCHSNDTLFTDLIWYRLTQLGLNVERRNCTSITDSDMANNDITKRNYIEIHNDNSTFNRNQTYISNSKIVITCITKDFQLSTQCMNELKFANDLVAVTSTIVPIFLERDSSKWLSDDMINIFTTAGNKICASFDVSLIASASTYCHDIGIGNDATATTTTTSSSSGSSGSVSLNSWYMEEEEGNKPSHTFINNFNNELEAMYAFISKQCQ